MNKQTSPTQSPRSRLSSCSRSYRDQYGANFFSAMPSNLYGPGDSFDLETSHVLAALGWRAETGLEAGIRAAYQWYCSRV